MKVDSGHTVHFTHCQAFLSLNSIVYPRYQI